MKRRTFAGLAGVMALSPREGFALRSSQEATQPVSYPEFAVQLAETYHSVAARTQLQSVARGTSTLLVDSAVAVINGNAEEARDSLDQFDARAQDELPGLSEVAEERDVIDFERVIRRGLDQCRQDVSGFEDTGDVIVDRIPVRLVLCLLRTPIAFEECLGPLWRRGLTCALVSIPMARLGVYGYAGAVGTCLFDDVVEVAVNVVADCFPNFRDQVGECFG